MSPPQPIGLKAPCGRRGRCQGCSRSDIPCDRFGPVGYPHPGRACHRSCLNCQKAAEAHFAANPGWLRRGLRQRRAAR